jgi:hypothetical protein
MTTVAPAIDCGIRAQYGIDDIPFRRGIHGQLVSVSELPQYV